MRHHAATVGLGRVGMLFDEDPKRIRWPDVEIGLLRVVVAALRAERIPVATGVGRMMSEDEVFLRKLAYGRMHHPLGDDVQYRPGSLPNAHRVHDQAHLAFFLAGWPNTTDDMDDIAAAFEQIVAHRDRLAAHDREHGAREIAFHRGRG